jgi:hypothetical protein
MRYRLRTLMLATTVAAVFLAWVAYMRRMALHHQHEAAAIAGAIVNDYRFTEENVLGSIERAAAGVETVGTKGLVSRSSASFSSPLRGSDLEDAFGAAIYHESQATLYGKAMFRPWLLLGNEEPPQKIDRPAPVSSN